MSAETRIREALQDSVKQFQDRHATALQELIDVMIQTAVADGEAEIAEVRAQTEAAAQESLERELAKARAEADAGLTAALEAASAEADATLGTAVLAARAQAKAETEQAVTNTLREAHAELDRLGTEADKARAETDTVRAELIAARAEADKTRAEADKTHAEVDKARAEVDTLRAEAGAIRMDLETARARADSATTEAEAAQAEVAKAHDDIEKARADARIAVEGAVNEVRAEAERALSAARVAITKTDAVRPDEGMGVSRMLDAIRKLDTARSLTDVFDLLPGLAVGEADRAVVLIVRGNQLRGWKLAGFGGGVPEARNVSMKLDAAGVITDAVRAREPRTAGPDSSAFGFAPLPTGRTGLVAPIEVGGQVVAVLYADNATREKVTGIGAWREGVEILARHAARCLETLTVQYASGTKPAPTGIQTRHAAAG